MSASAIFFLRDLSLARLGSFVVVDHLLLPLDYEASLKQVILALVATIALIFPDPPTLSDNYQLLLECLAFHAICRQAMHKVWPDNNVYELLHRPHVSILDRSILCLASAPLFAIGRRAASELTIHIANFASAGHHTLVLGCVSVYQIVASVAIVTPGYMTAFSQNAVRIGWPSATWMQKHTLDLVSQSAALVKKSAFGFASGFTKAFSLLETWIVSFYLSVAGVSVKFMLDLSRILGSVGLFLLKTAKTALFWSAYSTNSLTIWICTAAKTTLDRTTNGLLKTAAATISSSIKLSVGVATTVQYTVPVSARALYSTARQISSVTFAASQQLASSVFRRIHIIAMRLGGVAVSTTKSSKSSSFLKVFAINFVVIAAILFAYRAILCKAYASKVSTAFLFCIASIHYLYSRFTRRANRNPTNAPKPQERTRTAVRLRRAVDHDLMSGAAPVISTLLPIRQMPPACCPQTAIVTVPRCTRIH